MQVHPIYTEYNDCQDCYKCVRECPVKAIKIENSHASIINERCIYCGHCTTICPSNAKKVREDVKTVNAYISQGDKVVASLAPSYLTEFSEWKPGQLLQALNELGFQNTSETALGAEMVSESVSTWLKTQPKGVYFSSCCPTVVDLIHKYYPHLKDKISPITTPMLAHGNFLKRKLGKDTRVVFIGPCIAKKKEAEKNPGSIDAVITFKKLRAWLKQEGISPEKYNDDNIQFFPHKSAKGSLYPIDGGMISSMNSNTDITSSSFMSFSGMNTIIDLLKDIDNFNHNETVFLELMACDGGCINGPAGTCRSNTATKRTQIINHYQKKKLTKKEHTKQEQIALPNHFEYLKPIAPEAYSEAELTEAMHSIGKYSEKDELNCSGCGYETCRSFAVALLNNIAEPDMCVSYLRKTAQRQASLLMQKMPYAVALVNDKLKIQDSNQLFASLLGDDVELAFEHTPGLAGLDLTKLLPEHKHFGMMLQTGTDRLEKDLILNGNHVHLSLFTIQKHQLVCGIMHSFNSPEILKSEIQKRSKQVIRKNLKMVQKIALLLGENASETEAILNSLGNIDN